MVELLAPGVHTIETSFRPPSIQGVGTSTTGFIGLLRNGPPNGPPRLVTSFGEFERLYGGYANLEISGLDGAPRTNYLALAVRGYFNEGGSRLYLSRAFLAAGSDGLARATLVGNDESDARHLILRSRFPGSGANGTVQISEIVAPATAASLSNSPIGSLARTRGITAEPARATASLPAGALTNGMTLSATVNAGAPAVITFSATVAEATADADTPTTVTVPPGTVLTVNIDGLIQVVPIAEGVDRARTEIRDEISAGLTTGLCVLNSGRMTISSLAAGSDITVTVNQLALLGFTSPQTVASGTGLPRLSAITAVDLNNLFTSAGVGLVADTLPGTNILRFSTQATGNTASIDLSEGANTAALTALGFDATTLTGVINGVDGVSRQLFIRETEAADGWRGYTEQPGGIWSAAPDPTTDAGTVLTEDAHLVTLSLAWESVDGVSTSYEGLGFDETHPRYFGHRMMIASDPVDEPLGDPLVLNEDGLNGAEVHAALFATGRSDEDDVLSAEHVLTGGNDGTVPALENMTDALERLNLVDDIAVVAAPGSTNYGAIGDSVRALLIGHAESSGFRIAVCDPPPGQELAQLRRTRGQFDNTYAAFYAPWIRIANPSARPGDESALREISVPPSGHVCGIYARNDATRGVHKTPANEIIREAVGFERDYNQRHQEVLNPIGINVLRTLTGRGNRVYGGRLSTSDREVVYVSDRRFLNFLKQSIYISMQPAVFEPNGPELWSDVREAVASFLFTQWRNGALLGPSPEAAYFVRCDRSVISQDDLDNGRLICEIGVAIIKPAEFLVFRIGQKTADSRS